MIHFTLVHENATEDMLGFIPQFLSPADDRPAAVQFHNAYQHGGGWSPFEGFTMDPNTFAVKYPGDPAIPALAIASLRDERIVVYPHAWVAIIQPDGSWELARMD